VDDLGRTLLFGLEVVVLLYFVVLNGLYTLFTAVSLRDVRRYTATVNRRSLEGLLSGAFYKPLSILVPAYNESPTIVPSVTSLLTLNYPEFEVVVVNDGSSDDTLGKMISAFGLVRVDRPLRVVLSHNAINGYYVSLTHQNLVVIDKQNGGKADALNAGINASRYPLFCCIDADSLLEADALLRASRLFVEDREVIAAGGIVRVVNGCEVRNGAVTSVGAPKGALECLQLVEYTRGFLTGRTSWNFFGGLLIIAGAFGVFRKDMVMAIGGYRHTVGEDMDLVVRLHAYCRENAIRYKIVFVPDPVCWTQVPSDVRSLLKQRNRWHRGLIDSLWHSRRMFFNPRYGIVGMFAVPYFVFIEALGPLPELAGYASFAALLALGHVNYAFAVLFFVFAVQWGMLINLGSLLLDNLVHRRYERMSDMLKLYLYCVLEFFGYKQLTVWERVRATFQFRNRTWGKPARKEIERVSGNRCDAEQVGVIRAVQCLWNTAGGGDKADVTGENNHQTLAPDRGTAQRLIKTATSPSVSADSAKDPERHLPT
jgi:cellulose synthase/poly-beta-1,6-N-acetylglucosamine synthase-like glycosyltransferase